MLPRMALVSVCLAALGCGKSEQSHIQTTSNSEAIDSHLCEGETLLPGIDEYDGQPDFFKFKAKSTVFKLPSGRTSITYDLVLYVKPGRSLLYNGGKYLIEWKTIESEQLRETRLLLPSPLMKQFRDAYHESEEVKEKLNRLRIAAQDRFLNMDGLQGAFQADLLAQREPTLQSGEEAVIRIYDKQLEVQAEFNCSAFVAF